MEQQYGVCLLRTRTLGRPGIVARVGRRRLQHTVRRPVREPVGAARDAPLPAGVAVGLALPERAGHLQQLSRQVRHDRRVREVPGAAPSASTQTVDDMLPGVYYSTSYGPDPLVRPQAADGGGDPRLVAARVDPAPASAWTTTSSPIRCCSTPPAASRNFETTGARPYLYFVRTNARQNGCAARLDRDLVRVPIRFNKDPAAQLSRTSPAPDRRRAAGHLRRVRVERRRRPARELCRGTWTATAPSRPTPDDPTASQDVLARRDRHAERRAARDRRLTARAPRRSRLLTIDARVNFQPDSRAAAGAATRRTPGLAYSAARGYGWVTQQQRGAQTPHGAHAPLDMTPQRPRPRPRRRAAARHADPHAVPARVPAHGRAEDAWRVGDRRARTAPTRCGSAQGTRAARAETGCTRQRLNVEGVVALTHQESPPGASSRRRPGRSP